MATYIAVKIEDKVNAADLSKSGLEKSVSELAGEFRKLVPKDHEVVLLTDRAKTGLFRKALDGEGMANIKVIEFGDSSDDLSQYI